MRNKSLDPNRKIDAGTFGKTPACHALVDMMNRDLIATAQKPKVLNLIEKISIEFREIASIKNASVRETLLHRSKDYYVDRIDKMPCPERFLSLMKNVVHYLCTKNLKASSLDNRRG